ncbi:coproporphyrinogen III oxidase [Bradymonadaceae bacterium TMQ3]|uniref:coproporphyrinogen oxidase n=1 Tax=Lujinxingia sediminis TaxID=2480984 RepID=A0ABY0CN10_9DELT|nr:coproporphyrinogen III oxidase [Lujinxingia sediminis]RDV36313.1 coproporphyrinogen III oxidase [Bradymonadaceae bacterium TMQ3]RVU41050.1 coproporphyrinogen III oxidase [Lujinxingia sediminis]TXC67899.1 coproporphyrinogen III oxidase [Bradymonadales bacterium TMQ1]
MTSTDRTTPQSPRATRALELVESLQAQLAARLVAAAPNDDEPDFKPISWLRDEGTHGGGTRLATADTPTFNRASVNVSCVHYDDLPEKRLASATAISTIVHPAHPRASSMHMHISWTELKDGQGTWRIMADLNPSHPDETQTSRFLSALRDVNAELFDEGNAQGDRYFDIPALERTRGVAHFYLEGYSSGDFDADLRLARAYGEAVITTYGALLEESLKDAPAPTDDERRRQLDYHTLYLFQVLTLDRGTTSGLLVHDQNDVGIMGSLPAAVDRELLRSWASRVPAPQHELVEALADALPDAHPAPVDNATRAQLANIVRAHYQRHPEALDLQASGNTLPPTVDNHLKPR